MRFRNALSRLVVVAVLAGCTAQAQEARTVELGDKVLAAASTNSHGQWESAPWSGSKWIALGAGAKVTVAHPLGRKPTLVLPYLSFVEDDTNQAATRRAFLGVGDVANFYDVSDKYVSVENRTQGEFYLRLVLE